MTARIDSQTIARYRRGATAYLAEQNGEPTVLHVQTYSPEPIADDRWDVMLGWAIMAFILVLGIVIGLWLP